MLIFIYKMDILDRAENSYTSLTCCHWVWLPMTERIIWGVTEMRKIWGTFRHHKYSFRVQEGFNSTPAAFLRLPTVCTSNHCGKLETLCLFKMVQILHPFPQVSGLPKISGKPRHPWWSMNHLLHSSDKAPQNCSKFKSSCKKLAHIWR